MAELIRELGEVIRRLFLMIHGKDQPGAALAIGTLLCDLTRWRHRGTPDDLADIVEAWVGRQLVHAGERLPIHQWKTVPVGERVVVVRDFGTLGMLIERTNLDTRAIGVVGTVTGWVPGHGGDVVWVQHDMPDGSRRTVSAHQLVELLPDSPYNREVANWRAAVVAGLQSDLDDLQTDGYTLEDAVRKGD